MPRNNQLLEDLLVVLGAPTVCNNDKSLVASGNSIARDVLVANMVNCYEKAMIALATGSQFPSEVRELLCNIGRLHKTSCVDPIEQQSAMLYLRKVLKDDVFKMCFL